jgi:hypothetical protein
MSHILKKIKNPDSRTLYLVNVAQPQISWFLILVLYLNSKLKVDDKIKRENKIQKTTDTIN